MTTGNENTFHAQIYIESIVILFLRFCLIIRLNMNAEKEKMAKSGKRQMIKIGMYTWYWLILLKIQEKIPFLMVIVMMTASAVA